MMKFKYVTIEPNLRPKTHEVETDDTYDVVSKAVGGYIERIYADVTGLSAFANEEGLLIGLEPNIVRVYKTEQGFRGDSNYIVGNILFCGIDNEGETISLTEAQIEHIEEMFYTSYELLNKHLGGGFQVDIMHLMTDRWLLCNEVE